MLYVFPNDRDARSAKRLKGRIEKLQSDIERKELQSAKRPRGINEAGSAFSRAKAEAQGGGVGVDGGAGHDAGGADAGGNGEGGGGGGGATFSSVGVVDPSRKGLGLA
jgi:hypothetical protein